MPARKVCIGDLRKTQHWDYYYLVLSPAAGTELPYYNVIAWNEHHSASISTNFLTGRDHLLSAADNEIEEEPT